RILFSSSNSRMRRWDSASSADSDVALPRLHTAVDQVLQLPPIQAGLGDPERRGNITHGLAGRDQIQCSSAELGRAGLGHEWLIPEGPSRASLSTIKSGEPGKHQDDRQSGSVSTWQTSTISGPAANHRQTMQPTG